MAINKKLIHFKTKSNFSTEVANGNILDTSICFIKDSQEIYTHGKYYTCKDWSNDIDNLQTQINTLVSGDASNAIDNFNEIVAFLEGIEDSTDLDSILASIEQQVAGKQDIINDLATIRANAQKGATAVQPSAISDMETKTNASATYQAKGNYVTTDTEQILTGKKIIQGPNYRFNSTKGNGSLLLMPDSGVDTVPRVQVQKVDATLADPVNFGVINMTGGDITIESQDAYNVSKKGGNVKLHTWDLSDPNLKQNTGINIDQSTKNMFIGNATNSTGSPHSLLKKKNIKGTTFAGEHFLFVTGKSSSVENQTGAHVEWSDETGTLNINQMYYNGSTVTTKDVNLTVNGKSVATTSDIANKQDKCIKFSNLSASSWVADTTYSDFGYKCNLTCSGVTTDMYAEVVFDVLQASSGNYAPVCETGSGIVSIWSTVNDSITVPVIIITK